MSWQWVALGLGLALIFAALAAWALWIRRDIELAYRRQRRMPMPGYPTFKPDPSEHDTEVR